MGSWGSVVVVLCFLAGTILSKPLQRSDIAIIQDDGVNYRLPNDTFPTHYKVQLTTRVDQNDFTFHGEVQIDISVAEVTQQISIHARELDIKTIELYRVGAPSVLISTTYSYDQVTEIVLISAAESLQIGQSYALAISYDGILRTDEAGFYRSWYTNDNGDLVYLATTQFESTDARHGFPCYDEPKFKATFDISITHGKSYHAISNMAVKNEFDVDDEIKTTVFETTVKMSTYLIAFVVSNFDQISEGNQRVFTQPRLIDTAPFALEAGIKILDALATYLDVPYSINKMDQFAIPQFAAGAMENWGLVTYRESALLYNPEIQTIAQKYSVANIIAHEYAHQWFGNLISPDWWTYIWLNEGFATLYAYEATEMAYPDIRANELMIFASQQSVFEVDDTESTRPMSTYAEDPRSINYLFDNIAYAKSGCVLRMTKTFLTEPVWKDGLKQYFDNREFQEARDTDLFDALQTAKDRSDITLPATTTEILNTWSLNKGFPIITAHRMGQGIHFYQRRFLREATEDPENVLWWVPINIASKTNPDFVDTSAEAWFSLEDRHYNPPEAIDADDWFLINKKQLFYYRVNYDSENWQKLGDELTDGDYKKIDAQSRAQLLDDSLDLAKYDHLSYEDTLHIVKYLKKETEFVPWRAADPALTQLYRRMEGIVENDYMVEFVREISEEFYKTYGPISASGDNYHEKMARPLAMKWACRTGNELCLTDAHELMVQVIYDGIILEPETRTTLFCNGMRSANQTTFDDLLNNVKDSSDSTTRSQFMTAAGCNENTDILVPAITSIFQSTDLSSSEKQAFFNSVYSNSRVGLNVVFEYIKDNSEAFYGIYGGGLGTRLKDIANYVSQSSEQDIILNLLEEHESNLLAADIDEVKARMEENRLWTVKKYEEVNKFLVAYYKDGAVSVMASLSLIILSAIVTYNWQ